MARYCTRLEGVDPNVEVGPVQDIHIFFVKDKEGSTVSSGGNVLLPSKGHPVEYE